VNESLFSSDSFVLLPEELKWMDVAIVEDNPIQRELLELYAKKIGLNVVGSFDTGENILDQFSSLNADLVFMDINLKGLKNGVDTAKELTEKHGSQIIFTTAQTDKDVLGKAATTEPLDILIKPFSLEQLQASVILAKHRPGKEQKEKGRYVVKDGFLIYKDGHMFERLPLSDLVYAEGGGNYFTLHFKNKKATLKGTLGVLEKELPEENFVRVNRSFIIALNAISSFNNRRVVIHTKEEFTLSKSHAESVMNKLMGT
jgi:DNA-binding LytR/AlgR family response regulator